MNVRYYYVNKGNICSFESNSLQSTFFSKLKFQQNADLKAVYDQLLAGATVDDAHFNDIVSKIKKSGHPSFLSNLIKNIYNYVAPYFNFKKIEFYQYDIAKLEALKMVDGLPVYPIEPGYLQRTEPAYLTPLITDEYQLAMSKTAFMNGRHEEEASFYMQWRKPAFDGGYTVAAGLEGVIDFLNNFKFSEEDIEFLRSQKKYTEPFLKYLSEMKLDLDVDAVPEGTVMVGNGPVVRVSGPIFQCQIVESAILNIMNASSQVATRAARITSIFEKYCKDAIFADFSLRRSPSLDCQVARSAYIGGCAATATVGAAKFLGIKSTGTMAHSYVTSFQNGVRTNAEVECMAFAEFIKSNRGNVVLLVDTFDPKIGVQHAIQMTIEENLKISEENKKRGPDEQVQPIPLNGIRYDSGDLYELSYYADTLLKEANANHPGLFDNTQIFLTNDLDEYKIAEFFEKGAKDDRGPFPAKRFGVGTSLGNPGPLSGVYKLSAVRDPASKKMIPSMKLTGAEAKSIMGSKTSIPGVGLDNVNLYRHEGDKKIIVGSVIVDADGLKGGESVHVNGKEESVQALPKHDSSETLLRPIFRRSIGGAKFVYKKPTLEEIAKYAKAQKALLPEELKALKPKERIPLFVSHEIHTNAMKLFTKSIKKEVVPPAKTEASN